MMSPEDARCRDCHDAGRVAYCLRVEVSRIEEGLGHEKFRCESCGATFKVVPRKFSSFRHRRDVTVRRVHE